MRFYRYAIILVVIVALLTGVYLIVDKTTGSKEDTEKIELLQIDSEKVQGLTIKNREGEFVFEKDGNSWNLVSGGNFKVDFLKLNNIVSTISGLYAERVIEKNAKDLEKYGLSEPVVLTLKTSDGETSVVELGNSTITKENYYMKLSGDNTVYTISYYEGDILNASKTDIRNKNIFNGVRSEIKKIGFEKDGQLVVMAEKEDEREWKIVEPFEADGNIANVTNSIDAFIRTTIQDFVEEDAKDLSVYGLDKPFYAIETETIEGEKIKVLIGKEKGMNFDTYINEIYAVLEGTNEVFLIDIAPLSFLEEPLFHFVNTYVYEEGMEFVEKAYAEVGDKEFNIEIKRISDDEGEEKEEYYVDGKEVAVDGDWNFKELFKTLVAIKVKEIDLESEPQEEQPEVIITFHLNKEPGEVIIGFLPKDDKNYYTVKNGEYTGLIVEQESFDTILETYEVMLEYLKN